ncbi:MAG TPA: hypothetical protein VMI12_04860 [Puia sp.]|nr:hypothetical protein [Puia sp.]
MEAIIDLLQAFHLSMLEVIIAGIPIFLLGYWIGTKKVRKLSQEVYGLQKQVLDLNEEILFGNNSETPVIEIKPEKLKLGNLAK